LAVKRARAKIIRCRLCAQLSHSLSLLTALNRADEILDQSKPFFMVLIASRWTCKAREKGVCCKPPQTPREKSDQPAVIHSVNQFAHEVGKL
jgi:hypothetical protein